MKSCVDAADREHERNVLLTGHASGDERLSVGERGVLDNGGDEVVVCFSRGAYDRYIDLAIAGDTYGQAQMIVAGLAGFVPIGTRVLVIGRDLYSREVRMEDGPYTGMSGWVEVEVVK